MSGETWRAKAERRFWEKVDRSGECWEWQGCTLPKGYGQLTALGRKWQAHRFSWFLAHGEDPDLFVLHRCDNPACVNPDHLFLGTAADNSRDMRKKGRSPRGVRNGNAKLTPDAVREIRSEWRDGATTRELGKRYGVSCSVISEAITRKTWRHVC